MFSFSGVIDRDRETIPFEIILAQFYGAIVNDDFFSQR